MLSSPACWQYKADISCPEVNGSVHLTDSPLSCPSLSIFLWVRAMPMPPEMASHQLLIKQLELTRQHFTIWKYATLREELRLLRQVHQVVQPSYWSGPSRTSHRASRLNHATTFRPLLHSSLQDTPTLTRRGYRRRG